MSVTNFIKQHRREIDEAVKRIVPNARLNDEERRQWLLNDEGLYLWAKSYRVYL